MCVYVYIYIYTYIHIGAVLDEKGRPLFDERVRTSNARMLPVLVVVVVGIYY